MIRRLRMVRAQRMTIVNAMLAFVVLIVILQLWLLTATMNAYLGGDTATVVPAAVGQPRVPRPQRRAALVPVRPGQMTGSPAGTRRTQARRSGRGPLPRLLRRWSWRRGSCRLPRTSLQMPRIASALLAINICAYAVLTVMFAIRLAGVFPAGPRRSEQPRARPGVLHRGRRDVRAGQRDRDSDGPHRARPTRCGSAASCSGWS